MAQSDRKIPLLATLWNRLKDSLKAWFLEASPSEGQAKPSYKVLYLERCWTEDCLIEKTRKQLERQWQEVSNESPN